MTTSFHLFFTFYIVKSLKAFMHDMLMKVKIKFTLCLVLFLCLSGGTFLQGEEKKEKVADVNQFQVLLKELRELRTQEQKEKEGWNSEKTNLELLLSQMKARKKDIESRIDKLQGNVDKLKESLKSKKNQVTNLEKHLDGVKKWTAQALEKFKGQLAKDPFLGDEKIRKEVLGFQGHSLAVSDSVAKFWNILLKTASQGTMPVVELREILIVGKVREVTVLKLGAACAVFLTKDEKRCGLAEINEGNVVWKVLPGKYLKSIRLAIKIAQKEVPAEVVNVPVPRSRILKKKLEGAQ